MIGSLLPELVRRSSCRAIVESNSVKRWREGSFVSRLMTTTTITWDAALRVASITMRGKTETGPKSKKNWRRSVLRFLGKYSTELSYTSKYGG
jgi:hypothetical protein